MTNVTLTPARTMRHTTKRQLEILAFIAGCVDGQGYPPTIREILRHCGLTSTSGVAAHLNRLAERGLIVRNPMISRGVAVTPAGRALLAEASA